VAASTLLAATLPAGTQEPQPIQQARVRATQYGGGSGSQGFALDLPLLLELQLSDHEGVHLRAFSALPNVAGALLVGPRPLHQELPLGGTLLVAPAFVLPMTYDQSGEAQVAVDLSQPALAGSTVYVQAVELADLGEVRAYQLSAGLELSLAAAPVQEPLPWSGLPLELVLLHQRQATAPEGFELLATATAPTEGWSLQLARVDRVANSTLVYLDLQHPQSAAVHPQVITALRAHVVLGPTPGGRADVLIRQLRDGIVISDFALVGVLRTGW
jgi:hypothetical protein